jgi:hypothetical protein
MAEGSRDVLCCDGDGSGFERFLSWEQIISKHIALSGIFSPLDLLPAPKSKNKTKLKRTLGVGVLAVSTKKPGKILLVTARHSKSWALVKGHIDRSLGALESARREAFEEAGVGVAYRPFQSAPISIRNRPMLSFGFGFLECELALSFPNGPKRRNAKGAGFRSGRH